MRACFRGMVETVYVWQKTHLMLVLILQAGGLFCFQLFETTECGNGYVEAGEECDCGFRMASRVYITPQVYITSIYYSSIYYSTSLIFLTKYIQINYVIGKGGGKVMEMNLFCLLFGNNFVKGLDCVKTFSQVRMSAKTESSEWFLLHRWQGVAASQPVLNCCLHLYLCTWSSRFLINALEIDAWVCTEEVNCWGFLYFGNIPIFSNLPSRFES